MKIKISLEKLHQYIIDEDYKGYDPFDGLTSRVFISLGLNKFYLIRLLWIQFFKRSVLNLRIFLEIQIFLSSMIFNSQVERRQCKRSFFIPLML